MIRGNHLTKLLPHLDVCYFCALCHRGLLRPITWDNLPGLAVTLAGIPKFSKLAYSSFFYDV